MEILKSNYLRKGYKRMETKSEIKQIIFSGPVCTIIWADGTKTRGRCDEKDDYDKRIGFLVAYCKKHMPIDKFKTMISLMDEYCSDGEKERTISFEPPKKENRKENRRKS